MGSGAGGNGYVYSSGLGADMRAEEKAELHQAWLAEKAARVEQYQQDAHIAFKLNQALDGNRWPDLTAQECRRLLQLLGQV